MAARVERNQNLNSLLQIDANYAGFFCESPAFFMRYPASIVGSEFLLDSDSLVA